MSRQAARSGRAAFLLPAGTTVPDSGTPPSMTNFSIRGGSAWAGRTPVRPGSWARVPTMSLELSRPEAWSLFCEWTESPSLRKHVLAVEAAMRAYAPRFGEDEELWGITGLLHDLDYERHPDLETGHPRDGAARSSRRAATRPSWSARSPRTPTSSASRATRRWRRRCTPSTSCRGFIMACAYVRPTGHPRAHAEVRQEEDEDARLRRRGEPRRAARGRRGARRRLRRAPRLRDRRAGGAGRRAGAQRVRARMPEQPLRIVVLDGDETGQELLEQAIRVLDPEADGPRRRARAPRPLARAAGARRATRA